MQFPKFILNLWRIEQNELITKTLHAANTSYLSKHNANIRHSKLIKCQNSTYLQKKKGILQYKLYIFHKILDKVGCYKKIQLGITTK